MIGPDSFITIRAQRLGVDKQRGGLKATAELAFTDGKINNWFGAWIAIDAMGNLGGYQYWWQQLPNFYNDGHNLDVMCEEIKGSVCELLTMWR